MKKETIKIGIQGGEGSFNDEAIYTYLVKHTDINADIQYLYTTENVLRALHQGKIDMGQFAIRNTLGGEVKESVEAMKEFPSKTIAEYKIKIAHALMIRPDATMEDITTIMTHPQVLAQCKRTVMEKYPQLKQTVGEGELVDPAYVAKQLSKKKLPKNVATMSSKVLAEIYGLTIVQTDMQDEKENYTTFRLVEKI
jgi:prephenate dehydratase